MRLPLVHALDPLVDEVLGPVRRALPAPADVAAVVGRLGTMLGRAERLLEDAAALLERIERTRQDADVQVRAAAAARSRLDAVLDAVGPPLGTLAPALDRLAVAVGADGGDAAAEIAAKVRALQATVERDVVPALSTLGTVAPDVHDLVRLSHELGEVLGRVPGVGRIKRKVEQEADGVGDDGP